MAKKVKEEFAGVSTDLTTGATVIHDATLEELPLAALQLNPDNPRTCTGEDMEKLVNSLLVFPKMMRARPIVIAHGNVVQGGNMRTQALNTIATMPWADIVRKFEQVFDETADNIVKNDFTRLTAAEKDSLLQYWQQWRKKPTAQVFNANNFTDAEIKQFVIKDNAQFGKWDWDMLANEWDSSDLQEWGVSMPWESDGEDDSSSDGSGTGTSTDKEEHGKLTDKFVVPPFTVLDSRQGYWNERKRLWRDKIGDNAESREAKLKGGGVIRSINTGTSILDPVMAEVVCRWFGIQGGKAFDCFAGDTVFGFVSAYLGMQFTGIEIREEQAQLNNERTKDITAHYICDDGQNVAQHIAANSQDLLFSCPPYYDLEVYSDKPNDASNQDTYEGFLQILRNAFTSAVGCLKNNRFAVVVVGDVRDKKGAYYDFPADVKRIFRDAGMCLYNEAVLVEPIGTLPQRAANGMRTRKLGKCHQNVLVFYKGDTKQINKIYPALEFDIADLEGEDGSKDME